MLLFQLRQPDLDPPHKFGIFFLNYNISKRSAEA